jgi:hypothetical protein
MYNFILRVIYFISYYLIKIITIYNHRLIKKVCFKIDITKQKGKNITKTGKLNEIGHFRLTDF